MEALMSELFAAEDPYACPHGRPTILKMTDADLERRFGRR
jgi:DNA mismatch repair protein MutL